MKVWFKSLKGSRKQKSVKYHGVMYNVTRNKFDYDSINKY